jgi:hypothetical protein
MKKKMSQGGPTVGHLVFFIIYNLKFYKKKKKNQGYKCYCLIFNVLNLTEWFKITAIESLDVQIEGF